MLTKTKEFYLLLLSNSLVVYIKQGKKIDYLKQMKKALLLGSIDELTHREIHATFAYHLLLFFLPFCVESSYSFDFRLFLPHLPTLIFTFPSAYLVLCGSVFTPVYILFKVQIQTVCLY